MNPLDKITDDAEFCAVFERMRLREVVLEQHKLAAPKKPYQRSKTLTDGFSINWSEFEDMSKREIWDTYANEIIRKMILRVKRFERKFGVKLRFFRFRTDTTTMNRKVMTFDKDGVFVVLCVKRIVHRFHINHPEIGTEVADFHFQAEIGEY